jgi:hypothetical protein
MLGLSRVESHIRPLRRVVTGRADVYRVQSSALRTGVKEIVTRFAPLTAIEVMTLSGLAVIARTYLPARRKIFRLRLGDELANHLGGRSIEASFKVSNVCEVSSSRRSMNRR